MRSARGGYGGRGGYGSYDYDDHGESIYAIIPPKLVQQEKPPMYRSKHDNQVFPTSSTFHQKSTTYPLTSNIGGDNDRKLIPDKECRTLGKVPGSYKQNPLAYMQKASVREPVAMLAEVRRENPEMLNPTSLKGRLKGPITKKDDPPVMNLVSSKNFVVANAVEAILAVPKKGSVAGKDYLCKEDYGQVPKYLLHVKKDIEAEYDYIRHLEAQREDMNKSQVQPLSEDERNVLIGGLKAKWESVNTDYQATTHLTKLDTIGKTKRKEHYEAALSQIEKDIERLNRKNLMVNMGM